MDARTVAGLVASGRIAVGIGLMFSPRPITRPWLGSIADTPAGRVLAAGFGARDVAIGAGTTLALRSGGPAREWLLAGALADSVDFLATFAGRRALPPAGAVGVCLLAAGGAAAGLWAARGDAQRAP